MYDNATWIWGNKKCVVDASWKQVLLLVNVQFGVLWLVFFLIVCLYGCVFSLKHMKCTIVCQKSLFTDIGTLNHAVYCLNHNMFKFLTWYVNVMKWKWIPEKVYRQFTVSESLFFLFQVPFLFQEGGLFSSLQMSILQKKMNVTWAPKSFKVHIKLCNGSYLRIYSVFWDKEFPFFYVAGLIRLGLCGFRLLLFYFRRFILIVR